MGAAGSTRRSTVRNDDPRPLIIQVSEDVVRRLKASSAYGGGSQQSKEEKETKEPQQESQYQNSTPEPVAVPIMVPPRPDNFVLSFGSEGKTTIETISALEMRKQKEGELRENDKFWEEKLREIEARYASSEINLGQEFNKKLTQLRALVPKINEQKCMKFSMNVAECYKTYPNQTLKCSNVVNEFAKCVEKESTLT